MSKTEIERRLTAVERQLNQLANKIEASTSNGSTNINGWIDEIHGTFQNNDTYRQAARLGREWRKSQTPIHRKKNLSAK